MKKMLDERQKQGLKRIRFTDFATWLGIGYKRGDCDPYAPRMTPMEDLVGFGILAVSLPLILPLRAGLKIYDCIEDMRIQQARQHL